MPLCLSRAWSLLVAGRIESAERLGLLARGRAEEIGDDYNLGFADAFQAHLAAIRGDGAAAVQHAGGAPWTPTSSTAYIRRAIAHLQAGFGHLLLGELHEAASSLETVVSVIFQENTSHFVEFRALSHLGHVRQLQGNLGEAERLYRGISCAAAATVAPAIEPVRLISPRKPAARAQRSARGSRSGRAGDPPGRAAW